MGDYKFACHLCGDGGQRVAANGSGVGDVDAANTRARALYERLGLQVVHSSGKAVLLDGAQIHRMSAPVPEG